MKETIRSGIEDNNIPVTNLTKMNKKYQWSKFYYNESIQNETVLEKVTSRWENTFGTPFETKFFTKLFLGIRDITFERWTVLGFGIIQYNIQFISAKSHTLKKNLKTCP